MVFRAHAQTANVNRVFALAAMASIGMPLVVHWAHINRRWRDIDRRRWRVIDRRWRRGRRRNGVWVWRYGPDYYAYGNDCWWLRQQAYTTGNPYWWSRYNNCVGYY